VALSATTRTG